MAEASARSGGSFEIQFHSANALRPPRSVRLSRRSLTLLGVLVVAWLGFVIAGAATARSTGRSIVEGRRSRDLVRVAAMLDERVAALVDRYRGLDIETRALRERLLKVEFAYGLEDVGEIDEEVPWATGDVVDAGTRLVDLRDHVVQTVSGVEHQIEALIAYEAEHPDRVRLTPSRSPLPGVDFVLTTGFGFTLSAFTGEAVYHSGIDLAAPAGTVIRAPADGTVMFAGRNTLTRRNSWWQLGNVVVIRHGDEFVTTFGHCDELLVKRGQAVSRGDELATVGDSGWASFSQLHYGVWRLGETVRPEHPRLFILDRGWEDDRDLLRAAARGVEEGWEPLPGAWTR